MGSSAATEIETGCAADRICAAFRGPGRASLLLDGRGGFAEAWGPLVALEPRIELAGRAGRGALDALDALVLRNRARGGSAWTGSAALVGYDLLDRHALGARDDDGLPDLVVLDVAAAIQVDAAGPVLLHARPEASAGGGVDAIRRTLDDAGGPEEASGASVAPHELTTTLPRAAYVAAVEAVQRHIGLGDVYQANLTQRFATRSTRDPLAVYRALASATPAPRSAFLEAPGFALASVSPEVFLRGAPDGRIETLPIKGTRPRHSDPQRDARAARELMDADKDRAELTMIVDLERNDLGRVCETGSIEVPEPCTLRSFAAVHHLVARVTGRLRPGTRPSELIRATFPGGSITGAPKIRAMQILRALEPLRRGFYTGSLFWFGDDGSLESSILIRTAVMTRGRVLIGAGGGVVADSDSEAEWRESCDKARALLGVFGLAPEEAR